jgi:hypothetical protein
VEAIIAVSYIRMSCSSVENSFIWLLIKAYSIPMKLKYDCPAPSKLGNDLPLWKTATQCFLKVVAPIASSLTEMDQGMTVSIKKRDILR